MRRVASFERFPDDSASALSVASSSRASPSQASSPQDSPDINSSEQEDFYRDVIAGLSRPYKQLHPKYFYDRQGSVYFDQICALDEYYPYRTELSLLPRVAQDLSGLLTQHYSLVEFGAGSLRKVKPLLDKVPGICSFMPIDISGEHLHRACRDLQEDYPGLSLEPVVADFTLAVELPASSHRKLGFFPGSTIGNFSPEEARSFLVTASQSLGAGSYMLIGVDTKKAPDLLHAAYNDRAGITAKFNRNILERINRELEGDFISENFSHYAFYNPKEGRVEMHLVSTIEQVANIRGTAIRFCEGESIHTESSYKYTPLEFSRLAQSAGWEIERQWMAEGKRFAAYLLRHGR